MSAALSSATINPGIIEMQMSSVTAPQHDGGQVAHFIMLLSCCPLLVCEQGSLEGCCVAMYNSCSNSCMSGAARDTHRLRERQREVLEMDFVVFLKHIEYIGGRAHNIRTITKRSARHKHQLYVFNLS